MAGRSAAGRQVRGWPAGWVTDRKIRRLGSGLYIRAGIAADQFQTPTLATSQSAPFLLRRAQQIVEATSDGQMSARDLAAALNDTSVNVGTELCTHMRAVGITRPDKGMIRARLNGPAQLGYMAETLGRAITACKHRGSPARC